MAVIWPAAPLEIIVRSDPAQIAPVRRAVEGLCTSQGFDPQAAGEVGLCVNEALANVIRHAYKGECDRPIRVSARCDGDEVQIEIRDWGCGAVPRMMADMQHDPLIPGGLGLICIGRMMSRVEFVPQEDGMLLIMTRSRPPQGARGTSEPRSPS